jgi:transcriptional regulator with XRE-family HTH domain
MLKNKTKGCCAMEFYAKTFAKRLRDLRDEKNITLMELAEVLGIGVNTLSQYENNLREPKFTILLKLINYFNVNIDWLIGCSDIRKKAGE